MADFQRKDLVITDSFQFDNRWRFGIEIVDYATIERWNDGFRLQMDNSHLKRIKIHGLLVDQISEMLKNLDGSESLKHLEIDTLWLQEGKEKRCNFRALTSLSIDSVRVARLSGQAAKRAPPQPKIVFKTDRLRAVNLGSDAIEYVTLSNIKNIQHLMIAEDPRRKLLRFKGLQTLVCNRVSKIHLDILMRFACDQICRLSELHCNINVMTAAGCKPDAEDLRAFDLLFENLKNCETAQRKDKKIYMQGVRMRDFRGDFEAYHFEDMLIHCQHYNLTENRLSLSACKSTIEIDFTNEALFTMSSDRRFGESSPDPTGRLRCVDFSTLYPNLQIVHVNNEPDANGNKDLLDEDDLLEFLRDCRGLTTLKIRQAGFFSNFYDRLASLPSVQTLATFSLIEEAECFRECLNFDFLTNLRYLNRFYTNLGTKSLMIKLLKMIHVSAVFEIEFYNSHKSPGKGFFVKMERKSATQLRLTTFSHACKNLKTETELDYENAAADLNSSQLLYFLH